MRKRGVRAETDKSKVRELPEERRGKPPKPRPWEAKIAERQKMVRKNWYKTARTPEETGRENDKALAGNIYAFVRNMPPPTTERHVLEERISRTPPSRDRAAEADKGGAER